MSEMTDEAFADEFARDQGWPSMAEAPDCPSCLASGPEGTGTPVPGTDFDCDDDRICGECAEWISDGCFLGFGSERIVC